MIQIKPLAMDNKSCGHVTPWFVTLWTPTSLTVHFFSSGIESSAGYFITLTYGIVIVTEVNCVAGMVWRYRHNDRSAGAKLYG